MREWNAPELQELDLNATAAEWKPQPSFDGAFLGDGKVSGWFGSAEDKPGNDGSNELS